MLKRVTQPIANNLRPNVLLILSILHKKLGYYESYPEAIVRNNLARFNVHLRIFYVFSKHKGVSVPSLGEPMAVKKSFTCRIIETFAQAEKNKSSRH